MLYSQQETGPRKMTFVFRERPEKIEETSKNWISGNEYVVTDHQGNARVSFTTKEEYLATMENENDGIESAFFENLDTRMPMTAANVTPGGNEAARLLNSTPAGPGISLKVSAGDVIDMSVWDYYDQQGGYTTLLGQAGFINAVAAAFGGASGVGGEAQQIYDAINDGIGTAGMGGTGNENIPAAYLNYLLFDDGYVYKSGGFQQVTSAGFENTEQITLSTGPIAQSGYIFIYLSNESDTSYPVHFDDLEVVHTGLHLTQTNNYYPFGMAMQGVVNNTPIPTVNPNKHLYNAGAELQDELGYDVYSTYFREYDPAIGRFHKIDVAATKYSSWTPYQYGFNDPIFWNDPLGDRPGGNHSVYRDRDDDPGGGGGEPAFGDFGDAGGKIYSGGTFWGYGYDSYESIQSRSLAKNIDRFVGKALAGNGGYWSQSTGAIYYSNDVNGTMQSLVTGFNYNAQHNTFNNTELGTFDSNALLNDIVTKFNTQNITGPAIARGGDGDKSEGALGTINDIGVGIANGFVEFGDTFVAGFVNSTTRAAWRLGFSNGFTDYRIHKFNTKWSIVEGEMMQVDPSLERSITTIDHTFGFLVDRLVAPLSLTKNAVFDFFINIGVKTPIKATEKLGTKQIGKD